MILSPQKCDTVTNPTTRKTARLAMIRACEQSIRDRRWRSYHVDGNLQDGQPEIISPWLIQTSIQDRRRQLEFTQNHVIVNADDPNEVLPLEQLISPERKQHRRRGKLFATLHGLADLAAQDGLTGNLFVTATLDTQWHWASPRYQGFTPTQAAAKLDQMARQLRQRLNRHGIKTTCLKGRESHRDGTPHDHFLIKCHPADVPIVQRELSRAYTTSEGPNAIHGLKIEIVANSDAAESYIGKYITKNTTGGPGYEGHLLREHHRRTWGYKGWHSWVTGPKEFRSRKPHSTMYHQLRSLRSITEHHAPQIREMIGAACRNEMLRATQLAKEYGFRTAYETRRTEHGTSYTIPRWLNRLNSNESIDCKPKRWLIEPASPYADNLKAPTPLTQDQSNEKAIEAINLWENGWTAGNREMATPLKLLGISSQDGPAGGGQGPDGPVAPLPGHTDPPPAPRPDSHGGTRFPYKCIYLNTA